VLLLLCIVALPFSTSLFVTYPDVEPGGHLAAVIYAKSFLVTSVVFLGLQFLIIVRKPHLLRLPLTRAQQRSLLLRGAVAAPTYVVAVLGLLMPLLTLAACVVLGLFYFILFGCPPRTWRRQQTTTTLPASERWRCRRVGRGEYDHVTTMPRVGVQSGAAP